MIWIELAGAMLSSGALGFGIGYHFRPTLNVIAPLATNEKDASEHWADVAAGLTHAELAKRLRE